MVWFGGVVVVIGGVCVEEGCNSLLNGSWMEVLCLMEMCFEVLFWSQIIWRNLVFAFGSGAEVK